MNIGDMDQAGAAIVQMAQMLKKHYDEMVKIGFSREEALKLTLAFQQGFTNFSK